VYVSSNATVIWHQVHRPHVITLHKANVYLASSVASYTSWFHPYVSTSRPATVVLECSAETHTTLIQMSPLSQRNLNHTRNCYQSSRREGLAHVIQLWSLWIKQRVFEKAKSAISSKLKKPVEDPQPLAREVRTHHRMERIVEPTDQATRLEKVKSAVSSKFKKLVEDDLIWEQCISLSGCSVDSPRAHMSRKSIRNGSQIATSETRRRLIV
jgi:hypothetical protein